MNFSISNRTRKHDILGRTCMCIEPQDSGRTFRNRQRPFLTIPPSCHSWSQPLLSSAFSAAPSLQPQKLPLQWPPQPFQKSRDSHWEQGHQPINVYTYFSHRPLNKASYYSSLYDNLQKERMEILRRVLNTLMALSLHPIFAPDTHLIDLPPLAALLLNLVHSK